MPGPMSLLGDVHDWSSQVLSGGGGLGTPEEVVEVDGIPEGVDPPDMVPGIPNPPSPGTGHHNTYG